MCICGWLKINLKYWCLTQKQVLSSNDGVFYFYFQCTNKLEIHIISYATVYIYIYIYNIKKTTNFQFVYSVSMLYASPQNEINIANYIYTYI